MSKQEFSNQSKEFVRENPIRQSLQRRSSSSRVGDLPVLGDDVVINRKRRGPAYKQPSVKLAMRYKVCLSNSREHYISFFLSVGRNEIFLFFCFNDVKS
jgi:hypothetical protein